jgi:hypothetical protein
MCEACYRGRSLRAYNEEYDITPIPEAAPSETVLAIRAKTADRANAMVEGSAAFEEEVARVDAELRRRGMWFTPGVDDDRSNPIDPISGRRVMPKSYEQKDGWYDDPDAIRCASLETEARRWTNARTTCVPATESNDGNLAFCHFSRLQ